MGSFICLHITADGTETVNGPSLPIPMVVVDRLFVTIHLGKGVFFFSFRSVPFFFLNDLFFTSFLFLGHIYATFFHWIAPLSFFLPGCVLFSSFRFSSSFHVVDDSSIRLISHRILDYTKSSTGASSSLKITMIIMDHATPYARHHDLPDLRDPLF